MKMTKKKFALFSAALIAAPVVLGAGYYGMNTSEMYSFDEFKNGIHRENHSDSILIQDYTVFSDKNDKKETIYQLQFDSVLIDDESNKDEFNLDSAVTLKSDTEFKIEDDDKKIIKSGIMDYQIASFPTTMIGDLNISLKELNSNSEIVIPKNVTVDGIQWKNDIYDSYYQNEKQIYKNYTQYYSMVSREMIKKIVLVCGSFEIVFCILILILYKKFFKKQSIDERRIQ